MLIIVIITMQKKFLDRLVQSRFKSRKVIRNLLDRAEKSRRTERRAPAFLKGIHNGVFYRIKVPPPKKVLPDIPKLPPPQQAPVGFKSIVPIEEGAKSRNQGDWSSAEDWERLRKWWKKNWPVLVLNFGSLCTLTGFTRSDVLELRTLSMTGSISFVAYSLTQSPLRWTPIVWTMSFAAINATKIYQILRERKGTVHLTATQEQIYIQFFMPHGVTPKQFEAIDAKAEVLHVKKNSTIITKGEKLQYVYLIVDGSTRANILGRHLTAASTTPQAHESQMGGASGAWVGEMSFLESYWIKEQSKYQPVHIEEKEEHAEHKDEYAEEVAREKKNNFKAAAVEAKKPVKVDVKAVDVVDAKKPVKVVSRAPPKLKASNSLYTIVAKEDCTILRWSHADMESVMERSTDLRAAMSRAMSSAILGTCVSCLRLHAPLCSFRSIHRQFTRTRVSSSISQFLLSFSTPPGKVINFTVSRSQTRPTWSAWLEDWKNSAGAITIQVADELEQFRLNEEDDDDVDDDQQGAGQQLEKLPQYPVKKFA